MEYVPLPMAGAMPFEMPSYKTQGFNVFFGNYPVQKANWVHFKDLGQGYGKDMDHAFFMGQIIDSAKPFNFEALNNGYAKDNEHVYQYGKIVPDVKPFGFAPPTQSESGPMFFNPMFGQLPSYEKQGSNIFFGNRVVPDASWVHFKDLGQGYGKDMNHVFFMGQIIGNAKPFHFEVLRNGYGKDNEHVYHYGRVLEGVKPFGFQAP